MLAKIISWFAAPTFEDGEQNRLARVLNIILLSGAAVLASLVIFRIVSSAGGVSQTTQINGFIVFILIVLWFLMRQGYVKLAGFLTVGLTWILLLAQAWLADGIRDTAFMALFISILLANLLLGWRFGLGYAALTIVAGWFLAYLEVNGQLDLDFDTAYNIAIDTTVIFGLAAVVLALTTAGLSNALSRARRGEQSLAQSNKELQAIQASLEDRVAERTQGLELVATLSSHLATILDINELLTELVNQVQLVFQYYHVHIYRFDTLNQRLVVAAGTGEAGKQMIAEGHSIPANAPTSLVARAARTGDIIRVDNVHDNPNWLANALLPDTHCEMAVPVILEGEVVGVLDVQHNQVGGLDEGDENLLRSLAGQTAVAVRNARLFGEVEQALEEARLAQERYTEEGWGKSGMQQRQVLQQMDVPAPAEETRLKLKQQAISQTQTTLLTKEAQQSDVQDVALVSPVKIAGKAIGALQMYRANNYKGWDEKDIALVEAILDQVGQTAENIRLFEETRRRASREATIREITNKIRAATNLEQLMKITAEELGRRFLATHAQLDFAPEDEVDRYE